MWVLESESMFPERAIQFLTTEVFLYPNSVPYIMKSSLPTFLAREIELKIIHQLSKI